MKKTLRLVGVAAMVLLLAASCKKEEKNNGEKQMMTFSAGIEQGNSKTYLTPDGQHAYKQLWTEGDQIKVNGSPIDLDAGCGGKDVGTFSGEAEKADHYYAVYPVSATLSGATATFSLPETQYYNGNGCPSGVNCPMYASSDNQTLEFHNLCGLLQLNYYCGFNDKPLKVTKLVVKPFTPNSGQSALFGSGSVDLSQPNPTLKLAGDTGTTQEVTLDCGAGVELSTDPANPTTFLVVLPPYTYHTDGMYVDVYANGSTDAYTSLKYKPTSPISIAAGMVTYTTTVILPQIRVQTNQTPDDNVTTTTAMIPNCMVIKDNGTGIVLMETGVAYQAWANEAWGEEHRQQTENMLTQFDMTLEGLQPNTRYRYSTYAKWHYRDDVEHVVYSTDWCTFTTSAGSSAPDGFVDLGTHVGGDDQGKPLYWAKCNVGATNPQDYGGYYPWGDITARTNCTWQNYKYGARVPEEPWVVKYCRTEDAAVWRGSGSPDNTLELDDSDDAAYSETDDGIRRMPTKEEYDELKSVAYFVWTSNYNGKAGCIIYKSVDPDQDHGFTKASSHEYSTAAGGDEHIFIPAGGRLEGSEYKGRGTYVKIWTKTLLSVVAPDDGGTPSSHGIAIGLKGEAPWFITGNKQEIEDYYQGRYYGMNLRPVCEGN